MSVSVLVTGGAGFIGSHLISRLLESGASVTAVDRLSDYYSPQYKRWRWSTLIGSSVQLVVHDLAQWPFPRELKKNFDVVVHLAAQPGVRLPLRDSQRYVTDNAAAFLNVCRLAQETSIQTFVYASSSSVYGDSAVTPFSEMESKLQPLSIYGVSKLFNEGVARVLSQTTDMSAIGLRLFSVYGEWGRPDMAYWQIARSLTSREPFRLNGDGSVQRDFTHISDTTSAIIGLIENTPPQSGAIEVNVGGNRTRAITEVIEILEAQAGHPLNLERSPALKEDAAVTIADPTRLLKLIGAQPEVDLESGLSAFFRWYQQVREQYGREWQREGL